MSTRGTRTTGADALGLIYALVVLLLGAARRPARR